MAKRQTKQKTGPSVGQQQMMQLIQMYAQKHHVDPAQIMQKLHSMPKDQQKGAIQQMAQDVQQGQQQGPQEEQQESQQNPQEEGQEQMKGGGWVTYATNPAHGHNGLVEEFKDGGWIKGAVNPEHKGYCTPMTKETCTPRRKAFAIRAKNHFKQEGGYVNDKGMPGYEGEGDRIQEDGQYDYGGFIPSYKQGGSLNGGFGVPEHIRAVSPGISPVNHSVGKYDPRAYKPFSNQPEINIGPKTYETNASMGPVEPQDAKIEAEKGEKIVNPDLSGIWQIGGKKHSQGGTPLDPKPGSFIFSHDPNLAITPQEHKMMKFKMGGSTAKSKNTPSQVLGRNINIKEYNRYQSILNDPKADSISKTTAALMVDKYQKTMGQIAFLQENKKGEQAPAFSEGTAPAINPTIQQSVDEQKMFAIGGMVFPQFAQGGEEFGCPPGQCGTPPNCHPCSQAEVDNIYGKAERVEKPGQGYNKFMEQPNYTLYNKEGQPISNKNDPGMGNAKWLEYLKHETPARKADRLKKQQMTATPGQDQYAYVPKPWERQNLPSDYDNQKGVWYPPNTQGAPEKPVDKPTDPKTPDYPTLPYTVKGYMTPAQKADLGLGALEATNIRKYMPIRSHLDLPSVRLDKMNSQPMLNQINNQQFQAYNSMNASNPRQAMLAASNIAGKGMDATSQALGSVEAQNIGTGNQENLTNLQQRNTEQQFNVPADARYVDQVNTTNDNFDAEKRYAWNQVRSTHNQYQSQADMLAWANAAQGKWGRRLVIDPKTGKPAYQPTQLFEYDPKGGMRYNADVASLAMASGRNQVNTIDEMKKTMDAFGIDVNDTKKLFAFAKMWQAFTNNGKNPISSGE